VVNAPDKVLVSGASGLIGSAVTSHLRANGWLVTCLVRNSAPSAGEVSWDPSQSLRPESVSGFDAVVHLAGETIVGRWSEAKKRSIRDSRVAGTRNLAEALAKAPQPPRVFASASAIGFYGDRGEEVLHEGSSSGRGFLPEVCREWEAATQPASDAGIRTAHTRFGIVLSKDGGALAKMLTPFRLGIGGNMGNGRQWWSWIDLTDVVGAIEHVMNTITLQGPVNLVSPNAVTNAQFTKVLASVLSRPAIFPMPAFVARTVLGQMADELLLASQHVEPRKLLSGGYKFKQPDLRQSLESILKK
jgi:uncharacterized protein